MSDARSETIRVRVTPAERRRFEAAAGLEPLSSWIRRMLNHMASVEEVGAEQSEVAHAALGMLGVTPPLPEDVVLTPDNAFYKGPGAGEDGAEPPAAVSAPAEDPVGPDASGDGGDAGADAASSAQAEGDVTPVPGRGQSSTAGRESPAARKSKPQRDARGRCPHRVTAGSWCKRCGAVV